MKYLSYCRSLGFQEDPDYEYLRQLFRTVFSKCGYKYDWQFDWVVCQQLEDDNNNDPSSEINNTPTSTDKDNRNPTTSESSANFALNQKLLSDQNFMPMHTFSVGSDIHHRWKNLTVSQKYLK